MFTAQHITSWLRQPGSWEAESPESLEQFRDEYPYFLPAQYFKTFHRGYDPALLHDLLYVFPANPILIQDIFQPLKDREPGERDIPQSGSAGADTGFNEATLLQEGLAGKDYFAGQGIQVSGLEAPLPPSTEKDLMVVMSFSEWLRYLQERTRKAKEEEADKKALKTMWQKQKLAAAIEEEDDEIPETVFEMALNSIAAREDLLSESLAEVYLRQGKKDKAMDMYRKLSLQNPEKSAYFAEKIEFLQKDL